MQCVSVQTFYLSRREFTMHRLLEPVPFGTKLFVRFLYRDKKTGQTKEGCWNGLRLIPARTECSNCGRRWTKADMSSMLKGTCPQCGAEQEKWSDNCGRKSTGYFEGKDVIVFRVGNSAGNMVRTICTPSILELKVK